MNLLHLLLLLIASTLVAGHGRLVVPLPRYGPGYENDPIGTISGDTKLGNTIPEYVCRHSEKQARNTNPDPDWTAGNVETIQWTFSAPHVGDCEGYISYDYGKPREEMTWLKIANWPECELQNDQDMPMRLPSWLPAGKAVFRFHWYALHNAPVDDIEFYVQCADVNIHSTQVQWPAGLVSFGLINPPLFPTHPGGYQRFRNPYPPVQYWMTGPACSAPTGQIVTDNLCDLTAPGNTPGYLDVVAGNTPTIVPIDSNPDNVPDNGGGGSGDNNGGGGGADDNNGGGGGGGHVVDPAQPKICPSGTFVSVNLPIAPDSWCQLNCAYNLDYCDPDFCTCEGGFQIVEQVIVPRKPANQIVGTRATWRVIYIDWRIQSWNNLQADIKNAVDSGFNVINLAFHMGVDDVTYEERIADAAQVWRDMTSWQKQETKAYLAANNARLLVSMGGETMHFESEISKQNGASLCTKVGQWALDQQLDGVDVDMELQPGNNQPFIDGTATTWLVECTHALRNVLGNERLISHAPIAPYLGAWAGVKHGYLEVYKQAPTINILNIQYYNQGQFAYTTYNDLFVKNDVFVGTAIKELLDLGIPEDKLVVGKPVDAGDATNGHVDPADLRAWGSRACDEMQWSGGFMGWQYNPQFHTTAFAAHLTDTICHNVAPAPLLGSKVTTPLVQPGNPQPTNEGSSTSGWTIFFAIFGVVALVGVVGYFFYWRSTKMVKNVNKASLVDEYANMNNV